MRPAALTSALCAFYPQGTYFRNGPGLFEAGPDAYAHPFDGDGYIVSLALRGGRAHVRSRCVSPGFAARAQPPAAASCTPQRRR